jgi:hypothetical protein
MGSTRKDKWVTTEPNTSHTSAWIAVAPAEDYSWSINRYALVKLSVDGLRAISARLVTRPHYPASITGITYHWHVPTWL